MTKPRLLDLFSGAGGCARGYQNAGFHVVGVDNRPQPNYCGDEFIQEDALIVLASFMVGGASRWLHPCDAIHASPPCQAFTDLKDMHNAKEHEDLLTPTRAMLQRTGKPYVIENVEGAPMKNHLTICGGGLGLGLNDGTAELRRHRHFETNFAAIGIPCAHGQAPRVIGVYGGHGRDRRRTENTQDFSVEQRREAMGIGWMNGTELSQAIPPAYTEHIGHQLLQHIRAEAAA